MTLVRPGKPQPPDTVQFRIHLEMTKCDVRNYLEKIYNVPVATVRTRIQYGSYSRRNHLNQRVKNPDYKVAYVQLGQGHTFQFPDLFPETKSTPDAGSFAEAELQFMENEKQRQRPNPRRGGLNDWFGL
ncbi:large ribosomal subunit protein uL23m isoform X3 [Hyperolius riggenbachi]